MFVLVRGNSVYSMFRGNSHTFRRSAASRPRTDYKCGAICIMIGPWYHDPPLFSFFFFQNCLGSVAGIIVFSSFWRDLGFGGSFYLFKIKVLKN